MTQYKTYLVVLVVAAVGSFVLTPSVIRLALSWGAVDHPNARKIHQRLMPRMGGLAVYLAFCLPWAGLYLINNPISTAFRDFEKRFLALVIGATTMLVLGIYDDIKGANAGKKFIVQVLAAVVLWFGGIRIEDLSVPWGAPIDLNLWGLPLTILWIVGVTNAINLLDGIDGLVTGVTAVMAICLAIINVLSGNILLALLTLSLAGACIGFLPYNHSLARIFLGDTGSLTIGMVLGGIGILSLHHEGRQTAGPLLSIPFILFGLPLFDTLRVMIQRLAAGKSMFEADKNHVHHRLLEMGLSQRQAAWTLYAVAAILGIAAIFLSQLEHGRQSVFTLLFASLGAGVYAIWRLVLRSRFLSDEDAPEQG
jgi:UDP-GlcNAc:undecaprenyl-phosphate GlcNAc-1-phosphate transferase